MNSRERVQTALAFEEPDRPPVFATFVPEIVKRIRTELGINDYDLGAALGNDLVKSCVGLEQSFYGQPEPEQLLSWTAGAAVLEKHLPKSMIYPHQLLSIFQDLLFLRCPESLFH